MTMAVKNQFARSRLMLAAKNLSDTNGGRVQGARETFSMRGRARRVFAAAYGLSLDGLGHIEFLPLDGDGKISGYGDVDTLARACLGASHAQSRAGRAD